MTAEEIIDRLTEKVEDYIADAAEDLGISVDEVIDRLANELKARDLGA